MRVALAGVGHWHAPMHLDAARAAGGSIAGVWDPAPAISARFAAQAGAPVAADLAALLATAPDLVVVMGHPADVPATARACLGAGLPMMLEKPAASTTGALAAIAPGADRFVAVPLANRCSLLWAEHDRLRAVGRLGPLAHAHFRIVNGPPARYRTDGVPWLLDPATGGGGALRNLGLHALDAALALCGGAMPAILGAVVSHATHGEAVEDYAHATLLAPGGGVLSIEAGYTFASDAPGGDFEWRVATRNATLIDRGETLRIATLDDGMITRRDNITPAERYRAFMQRTFDCLRRGLAPPCGFQDYVRAMQLADSIYAAARRA